MRDAIRDATVMFAYRIVHKGGRGERKRERAEVAGAENASGEWRACVLSISGPEPPLPRETWQREMVGGLWLDWVH